MLSNYNDIYSIINTDFITNRNNLTINNSIAYKILHIAFRLRLAFEARVRQKDVCYLKIKNQYNNTNNTIQNGQLTPDQQFNLYLYIFNENSNVKIINNNQYISLFRRLINITFDVMKNYQ